MWDRVAALQREAAERGARWRDAHPEELAAIVREAERIGAGLADDYDKHALLRLVSRLPDTLGILRSPVGDPRIRGAARAWVEHLSSTPKGPPG